MHPTRVGAFELDLRAHELRDGATRIPLHGQPFEILRALLERPGDVITRDELRQRLWPDGISVDFEHSLNTAVKRLRAALGDDASKPTFVETVPRRGYRYIGSEDDSRNPARVRLVVLPFITVGDAIQWERFSNGLTDEVIVQLGAACPGIEIVATRSATFDQPELQRARDIGESLRAAFVLEGSARHHGARVRITARLVETATEVHHWSGAYDRIVDCPLSVQVDVAGSVARAVASELACS